MEQQERQQIAAIVHKMLAAMVQLKGSDLFLTAGFPPAIKLNGKLTKLNETALTADQTSKMARAIASVLAQTHAAHEIIVIGGHIDSWDVGRGALDDGGGCIAVWEALRILRELGLKPRRTIRCVLWTDEESGGSGARGYRDAHLGELNQHVLAVESDNGAFDPTGFGFTGSDEGMSILRAVGGLTGPRLGAAKVSAGGSDADTAPLLERGVPVASLRVKGERYFWYHHTEADTPEKVDPDALNRCAAALAILAFTVADLDETLPR